MVIDMTDNALYDYRCMILDVTDVMIIDMIIDMTENALYDYRCTILDVTDVMYYDYRYDSRCDRCDVNIDV